MIVPVNSLFNYEYWKLYWAQVHECVSPPSASRDSNPRSFRFGIPRKASLSSHHRFPVAFWGRRRQRCQDERERNRTLQREESRSGRVIERVGTGLKYTAFPSILTHKIFSKSRNFFLSCIFSSIACVYRQECQSNMSCYVVICLFINYRCHVLSCQ